MAGEDFTASAETPLMVHVDADLGAVEFVRRLHRGGLELRKGDDGSNAVIVRSAPPQAVRGLREKLFEAAGVVAAVRLALSSDMETDETALQDALQAAWKLINRATEQLEESQEPRWDGSSAP